MDSVNPHSMYMFLLFIWATCVTVMQKTNAQQTGQFAENRGRIGSSYFFFEQSEYPGDCGEVHDQCSSGYTNGIFYIKPDGYTDPFEVYCDTVSNIAGWTVIQRHNADDTVDFDRNWGDYKGGFGFLSHDSWIGNDKLSYLTNQKNYQLLIEITFLGGSTLNVSYDNFRIGDEFSHYKLLGLSQSAGSSDPISWCPDNMTYGNCTDCQRLCEDPSSCQNSCTEGQTEGCVCPEGSYIEEGACIPERECDCYLPEEQTVVPEEGTHINDGCTSIALCDNRQLTLNNSYECSSDAVCEKRNGVRKYYCNTGFEGDGEVCTSTIPPSDCMDVFNAGARGSGSYTIKPTGYPGEPFSVYCNMSDGGGWTVIQRRIDGSVDFFLEWQNYKDGFGDVDREHWLGNDKLHYLTYQKRYEIRFDVVNRDGHQYYGVYDFFRIEDEDDLYRLSGVGTYSGNADECRADGYYLLTDYRNRPFSTKERDNDATSRYNVAAHHYSAWWYNGGDTYHDEYTLNGRYRNCLYLYCLPGTNYLQFSEMKIRPV